jgi:hypothetical protein
MKTTFYVVAGLMLMLSSAQAWELRTSCAYSRFYGTGSCRTIGIPDQPPPQRDAAQEAEDRRVKLEEIKRWEAFCKPTRTYDTLGITRLVYAKNGCEFGRSE